LFNNFLSHRIFMNWILGILGIWIVIEPFLPFSVSVSRWLLVLSGLVIAVLAFWPKGKEGGDWSAGNDSAPTNRSSVSGMGSGGVGGSSMGSSGSMRDSGDAQ
jgi:hypothetical protein